MPGAINNLVADALNSAVPASEPDEFAGIGPIFSGASIEQADDHERIEVLEAHDRDEKRDLEQAWIASIQLRYWAAAAALVVLLTGTLLFWDAGPRETQSIPITVAVTPGATQVIDVERLTELAAAVPVLTTADEAVVAGVGEFPLTVALTQGESNSAAVVIAEEAVAAETIAAVNNGAETAKTIAEVAVAEETAVITTSSFVERLLQASPGDYAVQLLASHSQASIIDFIAQLGGEHPAGYFETRYQSKPWFVAVLASFDDRNQATAAISSLPAKLRSNEPWVRSVAGIQTDIRKLLDSKLVSVK
jgi:hypothetical protein